MQRTPKNGEDPRAHRHIAASNIELKRRPGWCRGFTLAHSQGRSTRARTHPNNQSRMAEFLVVCASLSHQQHGLARLGGGGQGFHEAKCV